MEVHGLGSVGASQPLGQPRSIADVKPEGTAAVLPKDALSISAEARSLESTGKTPSLREARLAQIKAQVDNGTYDTDERMELALSRMFERFGMTAGS